MTDLFPANSALFLQPDHSVFPMGFGFVGIAIPLERFQFFYDSVPECHSLSSPVSNERTAIMNMQPDTFKAVVKHLTAADVITIVQSSDLPKTRRRDLVSAVKRICKMGSVSPSHFVVTPDTIRALLAGIRPAAHGIAGKSFTNIQSNLRAALALADIIDPIPRGGAKDHPEWSKVLALLADEKGLTLGLALFFSYCAVNDIAPVEVCDGTVETYRDWLWTRTIDDDPDDRAREVARYASNANRQIETWPIVELAQLTVGLRPAKIRWCDLPDCFRVDAEAYLAMRANPDPFEERANMPARRLAPGTVRLHREHIRLAYDVLVNVDMTPADLSELVEPARFKAILRHYHDKASGKPSAYLDSAARTLMSIAKIHVRVDKDQLDRLSKLKARLPSIPFDLTEKNKTLVRQFDDEQSVARLLDLPDILMKDARKAMTAQDRRFILLAQTAIAIAILTAAPMRSQNLIALNVRQHMRTIISRNGAKSGQRGKSIRIIIPAAETKTRRSDMVFELDEATSGLIEWYRHHVLPMLGGDPEGDLFILAGGKRRGQQSLSSAITRMIDTHLGIAMTPHQFRHLAAALYLKSHPEDFETVRQLLGHSFGKTTLIYAGLSGERASKTYGSVIQAERERLRIAKPNRAKPTGKPAKKGS